MHAAPDHIHQHKLEKVRDIIPGYTISCHMWEECLQLQNVMKSANCKKKCLV